MPVDKYLNQFASLNTERNRNNWTIDTYNRAPHKPFLLLSVMDLIAQGQIRGNLVELSFELDDTWNGYWQAAMPPGKTSSVAYPFFIMKSEAFWHLIEKPGLNLPDNFRSPSVAWLRQNFLGARLDEELFALLLEKKSREILRSAVIQMYFVPDLQPRIMERGLVNYASKRYKNKRYKNKILRLRQIPDDYGKQNIPSQKDKVREAGF